MKYNSHSLLDSLQADVRRIILQATTLQQTPHRLLVMQPGFQQWSPAQILEHLNIYARHYIPEIENTLHLNAQVPAATFRPGWLGNYFTRLMLPTENNTIAKKMKAPKAALPSLQPDAGAQLQEFLQHQHHLLTLLEIAKGAHLSAIRIPTTLHRQIRMKLGDTFRFFIAHQQRHFVQLQAALQGLQKTYQAASWAEAAAS